MLILCYGWFFVRVVAPKDGNGMGVFFTWFVLAQNRGGELSAVAFACASSPCFSLAMLCRLLYCTCFERSIVSSIRFGFEVEISMFMEKVRVPCVCFCK